MIKFNKRKKLNEDMSLQITPMASVFTVILVFLLKSLSSNLSGITPTQNLTLPELREVPEVYEGLRVEISKDVISVDDRTIVELHQYQYDPKDLADDGSFKKLNDFIAKRPVDGKALILADVKVPYSTIKRVFASVSNQGYEDLKLIVVRDEQ